MSPLAAPPADLTGFPFWELALGTPLYRVHRATRSPWWFASRAESGGGRFDLPAPAGTCYLAEDPLGAFVEVFRETALVAQRDVDRRRLSVFTVAAPIRLADCTARGARAFGVTAAIHADPAYDLPGRWAVAFAGAGFDGVRYLVSHDPSARLVGVALFGRAGPAEWPAATTPIPIDLCDRTATEFGIRVLPTP